MEDYTILVNQIEELQTIKDIQLLEQILDRAKRTIIGGNDVLLVREGAGGTRYIFNTISNEQDFEQYRNQVFRYL